MKNAWFACYPQDFLADIGHLGNTELGIYWRLLLVYYRDGRPLPYDTDRIRRLAMAFTPEEQKTLEHVLVEFFAAGKEPDGTRVWRHVRADRELERSDSIITARQEASRIAHAKRWGAVRAQKECEPDAKRMPNASQAQCQTPAQPQPQPQPQEIQIQRASRADAPAARALSVADLVEAGANKQHAFDWLKARGKTPLTPTTFAALRREADKARITVAQAVQVCAERGWRGFKAEYIAQQGGQHGSSGESSFARERRQRVDELTGGTVSRKQPTTTTTTQETIDAHPASPRLD